MVTENKRTWAVPGTDWRDLVASEKQEEAAYIVGWSIILGLVVIVVAGMVGHG